MATITPQSHLTSGIAAQSGDEILADQVDIYGGDIPAVFATQETILTGQTLAARTVVGFDGAGKIVPAEAGVVDAIGVLPYAVDSTAGDIVGEGIWRGGNFKPSALVWDASYNTDALKAKAFEGAPSPTQIVLTETRTFTAA